VSPVTNDERACGPTFHHIETCSVLCEDAGAKPPVSANIDPSEEDDESHRQGGELGAGEHPHLLELGG
jgi:hypothetical protein